MLPQPSGSDSNGHLQMSAPLRWLSALSGATLLVLAGLTLYFPPGAVTLEEDANGRVSKRVLSTSSNATPAIALFAGGLGLLLYGVNGLRLTRFSAGGLSAESGPAERKAREYYAYPDHPEEVTISGDESAPEPSQPPASVITTQSHEDLAVYELEDVPSSVVKDALQNWPKALPALTNLGEFEFATRRRGKGNYPWTLKFRGRSAVTVSYGGRGKTGATVDATESNG